jgi:ATP-binding cassette subfamily B protein
MRWPLDQRPVSIDRFLDEQGLLDDVRLSLAADIAANGAGGEPWLIVTPKRTLVLGFKSDLSDQSDGEAPSLSNGAVEVLSDLPTPELKDVRVESEVGGGVLEVRHGGVVIPVIRFSNRLSPSFHRAAKGIERLAKEGALGEPPGEDQELRVCPTCGRRLFHYSNVCPVCLKHHRVLLRLLSLARPHWKWVALLLGCMGLMALLNLVPGYLIRVLLDRVFKESPGQPAAYLPYLGALGRPTALTIVVLLLGGSFGVMALVQVVQGRTAAWLGQRISFDLRAMVYQALQRLSLSFYDRRQVGHVMNSVTHDTGHVEHLLTGEAPMFIVNVLQAVAIAGVCFFINWRLALWIMVPVPAVVVMTRWFWPWVHRMFRRMWERRARLSGQLSDSLTAVRVVRAFGQEEREIARFDDRNRDFFDAGVRVEQTFASLFPVVQLVMTAGTLIIWYVGGRHIIAHRYGMEAGVLMQFVMYLGTFYASVRVVTGMISWLTRSLTATERVFEIIDTEPDIQDAPDAVPMPQIRGDVRFEDVTFGYTPLKPVLEHINLEVHPGEMLGLVGHSGAGKTTITNLLARFYDAGEGRVTIDGVDIRKIRKDDLHPQMGIVLQETILFNGTIADNIAYARPNATHLEIMRAAKAANAHDFIVNLPDGYDSRVGERGQSLSAGERQRVAIARAILGDPRILILDEATASVDTETEDQIQQALARLVSGRTTFAIAHRLSTLRNADRLFVIEKGHEAEVGTHDELIAKRGVYYRLVKLQRQISRIRALSG